MFFSCSSCGETFPAAPQAGGEITRRCSRCGSAQRLLWLSAGPGPLILELSGCQFAYQEGADRAAQERQLAELLEGAVPLAGPDELSSDIDWDEVEEITGPRVHYEATDELVDPIPSSKAGHWTVTGATKQKKYHFHYLGIMRKWVLDGVLVAEDLVDLPDGGKQMLKDYPPLVDLFDPQRAPQIKKQYQVKKVELQRQSRRRGLPRRLGWGWRLTLWLLALASAVFLYREFGAVRQLRQDRQALARLLSGLAPAASGRAQAVEKARRTLLQENRLTYFPAQEELARQLLADGSDPELLSLLSLLVVARGEEEQDQAAAARGLSLARLAGYRQNAYGLSQLAQARALWFAKQPDKVERKLARAKELSPQDPLVFVLASRLERQLGAGEQAVFSLGTAHRLSPQELEIGVELAEAYQQAGKVELAQLLLEENLGHDPRHVPSLKRLAESLRRSGNTGEAEKYYRQLLALRQEETASYQALAEMALEKKDYSQVLELMRAYAAAVPLGSHSDAAMRALADQAEKRLQQQQQADEIRQKAQEKQRTIPRRNWRGTIRP